MAPDVVTLGEAMAVFRAEPDGPLRDAATFRRFVGGAEMNVAVGLSRLGHSAAFVTRVGDDDFGQAIALRLWAEGVDARFVAVDREAPTGVYFRGSEELAYYRRGSAASLLSPADLPEACIRSAKVLHLSGITPALSLCCRETTFAAVEIARSAGVTVSFDPNMRPQLWSNSEARPILRDLAARSRILLPTAEEAEMLTGESEPAPAAHALQAMGPATVVIKLGALGCYALDGPDEARAAATPVATPVDVVGAGDAFDAGYLAGNLRGLSLGERLWIANICGGRAVSTPGDLDGLPSWAAVRAQLAI